MKKAATAAKKSGSSPEHEKRQRRPLQTTVVGSYPFPGWLEFASAHLEQFGEADIEELRTDAVIAAVHDQLAAGLDVITDGEQTRYDFNLSFYGRLDLIQSPRQLACSAPPAHDQRGKYEVTGQLRSQYGLGAVAEYKLLQKIAPPGPVLKASVPGPYTLSGRISPGGTYKNRWDVTEALIPIVERNSYSWWNPGCPRSLWMSPR